MSSQAIVSLPTATFADGLNTCVNIFADHTRRTMIDTAKSAPAFIVNNGIEIYHETAAGMDYDDLENGLPADSDLLPDRSQSASEWYRFMHTTGFIQSIDHAEGDPQLFAGYIGKFVETGKEGAYVRGYWGEVPLCDVFRMVDDCITLVSTEDIPRQEEIDFFTLYMDIGKAMGVCGKYKLHRYHEVSPGVFEHSWELREIFLASHTPNFSSLVVSKDIVADIYGSASLDMRYVNSGSISFTALNPALIKTENANDIIPVGKGRLMASASRIEAMHADQP